MDAGAEHVCATLRLCLGDAARVVAEVRGSDDRTIAKLARMGIGIVSRGSPEYPVLLETIPSPPPLLYVRGDAGVLSERAVAVVGSRNATAYGRAVAEAVAASAAAVGLAVVSGGALGIDGAAHAAALVEGSTIAVMGCGLDRLYPARHRELFRRMERSGCIISEFPCGMPPLAHHFPQRNRVIAGMAEKTVVVEAGTRSGGLITAGFAADYGREVLAVPGPVFAPQSAGCLALIADGATLLADPGDLVALMGFDMRGAARRDAAGQAFSDAEKSILSALAAGHAGVDDLADATGLSMPELLGGLTRLELAGAARRDVGGRVVLTLVSRA